MVVRAKFKVAEKMRVDWGANYGDVAQITLRPVIDGSEENKAFYAATPVGSIVLGVVNEAVAAQFEIGGEYYVDFTPAE